jgi:L-amino acid N-acyltransferase YncA
VAEGQEPAAPRHSRGESGAGHFLEQAGFRTVGVYKEQGQLDGAWVDTIIMERL